MHIRAHRHPAPRARTRLRIAATGPLLAAMLLPVACSRPSSDRLAPAELPEATPRLLQGAAEAVIPARPEALASVVTAEGLDNLPPPTDGQLSICAELRAPAAASLGLDPGRFTLRAADVEDRVWQTLLDGCQLALEVPGADLTIGERFDTLPAYRLRGVLQAAGWQVDSDYSRLSPGETIDGYTRPGGLCIVHLQMQPPQGRDCPDGDPTCGLPPAALDYEIAIRCASF